MVRGKCRVIAINNQGIDTPDHPAMAPWADVLYGADYKWWDTYKKEAEKFSGLKVSIRSGPFKDVKYLEQSTLRAFDPNPSRLVTGGNSGYQALHLAIHFGASRILLLGYDMKMDGKKKHWFGDYPHQRLNTRGNFQQWTNSFALLADEIKKLNPPVKVLNCTPGSALTCFPKVKLEDALSC